MSRSRIANALTLALFVASMAGCSGKSYDRYIPATTAARQALETGLNAWRDGQRPGMLENEIASVDFVDSRWLDGRVLRDYEIIGDIPGEGPRCFAVKLHLASPTEEQKVRYYVFGVDPLWVFRQEDYDMMNHWECMDEHGKPVPRFSTRRLH
jgi:hypothetical protein